MSTSPTQRSLELLRKRGYLAQVVERWNQYARVRQDVFGFGDILACGGCVAGMTKEIVLVQTTTSTNMAARQKKIEAEPKALCWLQAGGKIIVHGWALRGARGKPKRWQVREVHALGAFLPTPTILWEETV